MSSDQPSVASKKYSFEDLIVWQKSMVFCERIYRVTEGFPKEEQFGLTSQLGRASYSIPLNIAEGNASKSVKEFSHFLSIARGSQYECITILKLCLRLDLLGEENYSKLFSECDEVGRLLNALIKSLKTKFKSKKTDNRQLKTGN